MAKATISKGVKTKTTWANALKRDWQLYLLFDDSGCFSCDLQLCIIWRHPYGIHGLQTCERLCRQ